MVRPTRSSRVSAAPPPCANWAWRRRQKNNLKRLVTLPDALQVAIDDPDDHCSATHGLVLGQLARCYPDLDVEHWVTTINHGQLSVTQLRRAIHKAYKPITPPRLGSIFNDKASDRARGVFRFDAVKVVVAELDEQEREQLRGSLESCWQPWCRSLREGGCSILLASRGTHHA